MKILIFILAFFVYIIIGIGFALWGYDETDEWQRVQLVVFWPVALFCVLVSMTIDELESFLSSRGKK